MTAPWWATFSTAEAAVRCGDHQHLLRWEAGRLTARDHPDAEAELVLGTLGGDQPDCIRLVRAWGEHSDDLDVLMLGPRSAQDTLTVDATDAEQLRLGPAGWAGYARAGPVPGGVAPGVPLTWGSLWSRTLRSFAVNARGLPRGSATSGPGSAVRAAQVGRFRAAQAGALISRHGPGRPSPLFRGIGQDPDRHFARRAELLELLALGPAFQFRLCATVAAAWSQRHPGTAHPALTAALAGRLAPAAAAWLHVSPDQVRVSLAGGPGGLAQDGDQWRAGMRWVAAVWAAGLAVIDASLVLDVTHADYPKADVLALKEPGSEPAALAVQCESARGSPQGARWRIIRP